jgi:hypothetical protein
MSIHAHSSPLYIRNIDQRTLPIDAAWLFAVMRTIGNERFRQNHLHPLWTPHFEILTRYIYVSWSKFDTSSDKHQHQLPALIGCSEPDPRQSSRALTPTHQIPNYPVRIMTPAPDNIPIAADNPTILNHTCSYSTALLTLWRMRSIQY